MSPSRPAPAPAGRGPSLLLALLVVTIDQWSKWLVELHLPRHLPSAVMPGLNLVHVRNTGMAFGLFPARGEPAATLLLSAVGLLALAVVVALLWRAPADEPVLRAGLALVAGGAAGNLLDRVASGAVTDFVDVHVGTWHLHTFNLADTAIAGGGALLALDLLWRRRRARGALAGREEAA